MQEFLGRRGDEVSPIVDMGCGDGSLIGALAGAAEGGGGRFWGVERELGEGCGLRVAACGGTARGGSA